MTKEHEEFSPTIIDHFLHPRNSGSLEQPTVRVDLVNEVCGDKFALTVAVKDGMIADAKFRSAGCAVAIATASLLTEAIKGKTVVEAEARANAVFVQAEADTHGEKAKCRETVAKAWRQAAEQMKKLI